MIEILPNWHPFLVHFTIALLVISSVFYLLRLVSGRDSFQAAADWSLFAGLLVTVLTVLAGLQAYGSVDHDGPSHTAMTIHRNWALGTAGFWIVLGGWRYLTRNNAAGSLFTITSLLASGSLLVTGYLGAEVVYRHGIGVMRLPEVSGDGHEHDHGAGEDLAPSTAPSTDHEDQDDHDHDHEPSSSDAGETASETGYETHVHEDASTHDHDASLGETPNPDSPEGVVAALHEALASGNTGAVEALLDPDVIILEGGGSERSFEEYASHHMGADMEFVGALERSTTSVDSYIDGDMAWVITEGRLSGTYDDNPIDITTLETAILRRSDGRWRIVHLHWS